MPIIRVSLKHNGRSWAHGLPSGIPVPGSIRPNLLEKVEAGEVLPGVDPADPALRALTVEVEVPDADFDAATGAPKLAELRRRYPRRVADFPDDWDPRP